MSELPVLKSGIEVATYDEEENTLVVVLPDGMSVHVIAADSGCVVDVEHYNKSTMMRARRICPAPTLEARRGC